MSCVWRSAGPLAPGRVLPRGGRSGAAGYNGRAAGQLDHRLALGAEAPFDEDGPGTSDLDLTLVGDGPLAFFKPTGYFVPGVHSRPLSDDDPDIAPDLVPLRHRLMEMVKRPVNIQASREIVIQVRGDLIGQPYLTLFKKPEGLSLSGSRPARRLTLRLLTYNIRMAATAASAALASVINACAPDLVLLQEATDPGNVERLAEATGMADWKAYGGQSLGFLSREPVAYSEWTRPRVSRHAFIEMVPAGERRAHLRRAPERGPCGMDRAAARVRAAGAAAQRRAPPGRLSRAERRLQHRRAG